MGRCASSRPGRRRFAHRRGDGPNERVSAVGHRREALIRLNRRPGGRCGHSGRVTPCTQAAERIGLWCGRTRIPTDDGAATVGGLASRGQRRGIGLTDGRVADGTGAVLATAHCPAFSASRRSEAMTLRGDASHLRRCDAQRNARRLERCLRRSWSGATVLHPHSCWRRPNRSVRKTTARHGVEAVQNRVCCFTDVARYRQPLASTSRRVSTTAPPIGANKRERMCVDRCLRSASFEG